MIARVFFCGLPALIAGLAASITAALATMPFLSIGTIVLASVITASWFFAFGWEVTTPRPDREECP